MTESESDNDNDISVPLQNNPQHEMDNEVHTGCNVISHELPAQNIQSQINELVGYCIPCDNLDQNVRPSYQRQDRTTNSLHYFHSYAVKNRIDISTYSDDPPDSLEISPDKILPTQADLRELQCDFKKLIERYNHAYIISNFIVICNIV